LCPTVDCFILDYVPECALAPLQAAKRAFELLDDPSGLEEIPMIFKVARAGDEYILDSNHSVRVFATDHRVPSLGYAIMKHEKRGLSPQYVGLPREELIALRDRGVDIQPVTTTVDICYTGDTRIAGLDSVPLVWQSRVLITELSFLDDGVSVEGAESKGHIHLYDIAARARAGKFDGVEALLFIHMSARYTHGETICQLVASQWPQSLQHKVNLALEAFFVNDSRTEWAAANAFSILPSPYIPISTSSTIDSGATRAGVLPIGSPPLVVTASSTSSTSTSSSISNSIMCSIINDADARTSVANRLAILAQRRGLRAIGAACYRVPLSEAQANAYDSSAKNKNTSTTTGSATGSGTSGKKGKPNDKGKTSAKKGNEKGKDIQTAESKLGAESVSATLVSPLASVSTSSAEATVKQWAYKISLRSNSEDTSVIAKAWGNHSFPTTHIDGLTL
jgi:hypothetical protein